MIDWQSKVVAPCVTAFGQSASIAWAGQVFALNGVFDEAYAETDVSDGMPVTTVRPCLGISTSDVNLNGQPLSALQGARVTVFASVFAGGVPAADTVYVVQEVRADGHGAARLMLNIAPTGPDDVGAGQDA